jgi:hypothetical protein
VYHRIDSNALKDGKIGFDTAAGKYFDIPNQNPYVQERLALGANFAGAVSPAFNFTPNLGYNVNPDSIAYIITYKLPDGLMVVNDHRPLVGMEMDFADGGGFVPVALNTIIPVQYFEPFLVQETPWRDKMLRLRWYYQHTVNEITTIDTVEAKIHLTIAIGVQPPDDVLITTNLPIQNACAIPQPHGEGKAKVYVLYGDGNQNTLRKPVLFVEGFDTGIKRKYGTNTWPGFVTGYFSNGDGDNDAAPQLRKLPQLIGSLRQLGYDVLIVDHEDGTTWIERNAVATIKLIQWANEELSRNGSTEEIVVLGASMGGLIARYSVRQLELANCCHNVRLYGTFDSPHRGANIPLGVQKMIQQFAYNVPIVSFSKNLTDTYEKMLCSPGAMQMVKYHTKTLSPFVGSNLFGNPQYWNYNPNRNALTQYNSAQIRQDWVDLLDSIGHPQNAFRIAIANGSINATPQPFNAGDEIFDLMLDVDAPIGYPWQYQSWPIMGTKVFAITTNANHTIVERKGLVRGAFSVGLLYTDLAVFGAGWAARIPTFGLSDAVFEPIMQGLHQLNNSLHKYHKQNSTLLPYDNCPGSTAPTMKEVETEFFHASWGLLTNMATQPSHSFVATGSALDLDTNDLDIHLISTYQLLQDFKKIPFDSIWFPGTFSNEGVLTASPNQVHVEMTTENINWLIGMIEGNRYQLTTPGVSALYKNLQSTYNYGRATRRYIRQVDVNMGGKLLINHGAYGFDSTYFGATPAPKPGSFMAVYTSASNCAGSWVRVKNGGLVELGSQSTYGNLHITAGTFLEIESGGVLRINEQSTLIIEPGAELIIHPGAVIDLAGPNAVLELQGKVTLLPGASLNPTGTGIVRFAQAMQSPADAATFWQTSSNNEVKLLGTNGQKRAEITQNLFMPSALDSVVFSGVTATLAPDVSLHISTPPVRFNNSNFVGADTTQQHEGVHLAGQKALVGKSSFKHGVVGLKNVLPGGQVAFSISNCTFTHNTTGYMQHGGQLLAEQCIARYNTTGLLIEAATNSISINGGIYAHNTQNGINVINAQANTTLYANEAAINNNANAGIAANCHVRPTCCNITGNLYGIAHNGASGVLLHDGAQNQLTNNTWAVAVQGSIGVHLENGQNNFSGSANYVNGELPQLNANPSIDVLENFMPGTGSGNVVTLPIDVKWRDLQNNLYPIPVANWSPTVTLPSNCAPLPGGANPGNDLAGDIMMGYISTKVVNTSNYTNVWLHQALADAARKVSNPEGVYNDLLAIARFNEILSNINGTLTDAEMQATRYAAELMIAALNNAYEQGLVPQNGGTEGNPEHPYLQLVTGQINNLMANAGLSAEEHFNLTLALAQTYRMAEHFDYALGVLDSAANPVTAEELLHTEYWQCVCLAEEQLVQEAITPDQFSVELENCRGLLAQFNKWQQVLVPGYTEVSNTKGQANLFAPLYPNPAGNGTLLQLEQPGIPAQVTLLDVTGKTLQVEEIPGTSQSHLLDLQHYADGVYLVKVTQGNKTETQRLVVRN